MVRGCQEKKGGFMEITLKARTLTSCIHIAMLTLGIVAAYQGKWIVAMFWAITWASENIAVSIDAATWKKPKPAEKIINSN